MPHSAGNLTQLLQSDLDAAGYNPSFIGPHQPGDERYQAVLASLSRSLLKKYTYEDPAKDEERNSRALELFLACNNACKDWSMGELADPALAQVVGEVKASLDDFCHPEAGRGILLTFNKIREGLDVGKGANVGHLNVDFYSKVFCSQLTASTSDLVDLYRLAISDDPIWSSAEKCRETMMGHRIVRGSVLTYVPKTEKISRTICTEPLANMLFQKGIERVLNSRLRQVFGIDLSRQPDKNRALARIGSISDQFSTIDLSSASDLNSISMIKELFPPAFYRWLERTRSSCAVLPDGSSVELHMMSSMGNAFTFPLQTILFASIVKACYKVLGLPFKKPYGNSLGSFGVFGDDIVVRHEAYDLVIATLKLFGHQPNLDKSFNRGPFRESCGSDWYLGHDIRGVYIKRLDDVCDFYSTINRLNIWSAKHKVFLPNTIRWLLSQCKRKFYVPMHEQETAGIRVPRGFYNAGQGGSWQLGLNYKCLVVTNYKVILSDEESFVAATRKRGGGQKNPKALYLAKAWYNADGHLLAALSGRLRDGSFFIREFRRRTVVKRRRSSCWDYVGRELTERPLAYPAK